MSWLERLGKFREVLKTLGYERERAAVALLSLSFFGVVYFLVALNAPEGWGPVFAALATCYLAAFVALAAEWFWARWFASGLGWSGFMVGLMSLVMLGWLPALVVYTVLHALVIAMLMGAKMAARYEMQPVWRQRYAMDEYGVARLGKAVTRASASLPTLIMWALAPREGQGMEAPALVGLVLLAAGILGLLRLRTWGLVALAGTVAAVAVTALVSPELTVFGRGALPLSRHWDLLGAPGMAVLMAAWAMAPLLGPAWRFLRASSPDPAPAREL